MPPKCPCHGCTPETGRHPGCHTEDCPHGWAEYDRQRQAEREARRRHESDERVADSVAIHFRRTQRKKYDSKHSRFGH